MSIPGIKFALFRTFTNSIKALHCVGYGPPSTVSSLGPNVMRLIVGFFKLWFEIVTCAYPRFSYVSKTVPARECPSLDFGLKVVDHWD